MQGKIEIINNVLNLEKKKNYNNTAVTGGLKSFLPFLLKLGSNSENLRSIIDYIAEIFSSYEGLDHSERISAIGEIQKRISQELAVNPSQSDEKLNIDEIYKESLYQIRLSQEEALFADIQSLSGIGRRNSKIFNRLGIYSVYDLITYYPRRYQDFSKLKPISKISFGDELTVIGTLTNDLVTRLSKNGKLKITETVISDGTGSLRVFWFNKPYLSKQLHRGVSIVISGKIDVYLGRLVINNPEWESIDKEQLHTNRIIPIYPLTTGITQRQLRKIINNNISFWGKRIIEYFPKNLINEENLIEISNAIIQIHFPQNLDVLNLAKKRFAFEEIFFLQLGVLMQKRDWTKTEAKIFNLNIEKQNRIINSLPFQLTNAQKKAIEDISIDLASSKPMNRLLQGDVGSGKTVVSRFAIEAIIKNNAQVAVLAPTAILAEQHYKTLLSMLTASESLNNHEVALLTGSTSQKDRKIILEKLASNEIKVIIGTHALLEDSVKFFNLQLAIIDEQHRFGVEQRNSLKKKGYALHLLVMTATPIPRSLALTIYGDLDVSIIDELPEGRQEVETKILQSQEREIAYSMIRSQIHNGFQAFIIYPLIEGEDEDDYSAAVNEYERISREVFPDLNVGLLHGKIKTTEKDHIMQSFRDHKFDILVSTTVIEVGVDIPNATIVLIESANRFGLAQLHQIRGRVGRNKEKSYCFLIPDEESKYDNDRLNAMVRSNNGFELADFDLKLRGPGEFLGTRQSGFITLRFANITDLKMIERCRKQAQKIISSDPDLSYPEHQLLSQELHRRWPQINIY